MFWVFIVGNNDNDNPTAPDVSVSTFSLGLIWFISDDLYVMIYDM